MIATIMKRMIDYSVGDKKKEDIAHFLKVHNYAKTIGELEKIDKRTQCILELTAIVHDIACPMCREKYGHSAGNLQEIEGPALVKELLHDIEKDIVERVAYIVGHHHTYEGVDGLDYQIMLEADFLVNADEMHLKKEAILNMRKNVFKTESGIALLNSIYDL